MTAFDDAMEKLDALDGLKKLIEEIDLRRQELENELTALTDEHNVLKEDRENADAIHFAIDDFLDLLDRPVGKLEFTIPTGDRVNRAILALFDAVGRNV